MRIIRTSFEKQDAISGSFLSILTNSYNFIIVIPLLRFCFKHESQGDIPGRQGIQIIVYGDIGDIFEKNNDEGECAVFLL
jgi:hypothetical protein